MPRATFSGVRLVAVDVQGMNTTVSYPDVTTFEVFMKMKEATDAVLSPPLALDGPSEKGKDNPKS